jgi:DNA polymerase-3 subunit delta'
MDDRVRAWYPRAVLLEEIRGQNTAVRVLQRALRDDRLAHAYLFDGPSGVGKQHAAIGLAKAALCPVKVGKGCDQCRVCARIDAGNHPDARIFGPRAEGNRNIQVEALRNEILPVAQFAPFEAARAFLIFPEADVSFPIEHPESANALLKTLEEPRPNVCFILLSERADRLLVTIRSRCQRLRFGRLPSFALDHVLETHEVHEDLRGPAMALADGRADRALALCQDNLAATLLERALRIDAELSRAKMGMRIELAEELSKQPDLALTLDTLAAFYRDVAAASLGVERHKLFFAHAADQIRERAAKLGAARAAARAQTIAAVHERFVRNANTQIVLDRLLTEL